MADDKKPLKSAKIADVAHPGKSAPSPNSKSVIITHRAIMRDPMMNMMNTDTTPAENPDSESVGTVISVGRSSSAVVQPLSAPSAEAESAPIAPGEEAPVPESEATVEPSAPSNEYKETVPVERAEPQSPPKPAQPDTVKESESPPKMSGDTDAKLGTKDIQSDAEIAAAEDAEAKRQAELDEMVESKMYYLPINTLEKQRTKQFIASGILLSLLLIVVWADVALDAGLIRIGHLKALTHFFN